MRLRVAMVCLLLAGAAGAAETGLEAAQEAFVAGKYQKAIDLATPEIKQNPSRAWRVIGASHCFLKNKEKAREAYSHLDKPGQQFLKYVCNRNDVVLGD